MYMYAGNEASYVVCTHLKMVRYITGSKDYHGHNPQIVLYL